MNDTTTTTRIILTVPSVADASADKVNDIVGGSTVFPARGSWLDTVAGVTVSEASVAILLIGTTGAVNRATDRITETAKRLGESEVWHGDIPMSWKIVNTRR